MDNEFVRVSLVERLEELKLKYKQNEVADRSVRSKTVIRCELKQRMALLSLVSELVDDIPVEHLSDLSLKALEQLMEPRRK